jgi:hypothetical protein
MPEGIQNSIVGVAGMKGHGKSTWLRTYLSDSKALALIDTLGEHRDWCPPCPEKDIDKQVRWLAEPPEEFRASFMISPRFKDENGDNLHFNKLCQSIYMAGDMDVVIEESDRWYPNSGGASWANPAAGTLVEYGRHRQLDLVWVTRNLTIVDRKLTSQTDIFVLFKQQEPRYLESMRERFTDEIIDTVEALEHFEFVIVHPNKEWHKYKLSKEGQSFKSEELESAPPAAGNPEESADG